MELAKKEEADALQQEYREARAEFAADLQLLSLLKNANPVADEIVTDGTARLAFTRVTKSRVRYENAVKALHQALL